MLFTDLVTVDQVVDASANSIDASFKTDATKKATMQEIIEGVTSLIEKYLNRVLIVRKHFVEFTNETKYISFAEGIWRRNPVKDNQQVITRQWPNIQIVVPATSITIAKRDKEKRILEASSALTGENEIFQGYRRADQVLSGAVSPQTNLPTQVGEELEGLTVLPDLLPSDITLVAINLCIGVMLKRLPGLVGIKRRSQHVGLQDEVKTDTLNEKSVQQELSLINNHKYIQF